MPSGTQRCFATPVGYDAGGTVTALDVGAWDGNGSDIVFASGGQLSYLPGGGTGTFAASVKITGASFDTVNDLALGLLDNGTNLDIVVGGPTATKIVYGDGTGASLAIGQTNAGEGRAYDVQVADIFGSAATADVFQASVSDGDAAVMMTNGNAQPSVQASNVDISYASTGTLARTSATHTSAVWVKPGDTANLRFVPLTVNGTSLSQGTVKAVALEGNAGRMVAVDLDGDGYQEVVVLVGDKVNVFKSDGNDGWVAQGAVSYVSLAACTGPADLAAGDLDGDGDLDVAIACTGEDAIALLINDGKGNLSVEKIALDSGAAPTRIAVGDVNKDGVADIVVAATKPDDLVVVLSKP